MFSLAKLLVGYQVIATSTNKSVNKQNGGLLHRVLQKTTVVFSDKQTDYPFPGIEISHK